MARDSDLHSSAREEEGVAVQHILKVIVTGTHVLVLYCPLSVRSSPSITHSKAMVMGTDDWFLSLLSTVIVLVLEPNDTHAHFSLTCLMNVRIFHASVLYRHIAYCLVERLSKSCVQNIAVVRNYLIGRLMQQK